MVLCLMFYVILVPGFRHQSFTTAQALTTYYVIPTLCVNCLHLPLVEVIRDSERWEKENGVT